MNAILAGDPVTLLILGTVFFAGLVVGVATYAWAVAADDL